MHKKARAEAAEAAVPGKGPSAVRPEAMSLAADLKSLRKDVAQLRAARAPASVPPPPSVPDPPPAADEGMQVEVDNLRALLAASETALGSSAPDTVRFRRRLDAAILKRDEAKPFPAQLQAAQRKLVARRRALEKAEAAQLAAEEAARTAHNAAVTAGEARCEAKRLVKEASEALQAVHARVPDGVVPRSDKFKMLDEVPEAFLQQASTISKLEALVADLQACCETWKTQQPPPPRTRPREDTEDDFMEKQTADEATQSVLAMGDLGDTSAGGGSRGTTSRGKLKPKLARQGSKC